MNTKLPERFLGTGEIIREAQTRGIFSAAIKQTICIIIGHPKPNAKPGSLGIFNCPRCWEAIWINNGFWD